MASGLRRYKTYELSTVVEQEIEPSLIRARGRRCRQTLVGRSVKGIWSQRCHFIRAACDDHDVSTGSCTLFIVFRHKKCWRCACALLSSIDERCLIGGRAGYGYRIYLTGKYSLIVYFLSLRCLLPSLNVSRQTMATVAAARKTNAPSAAKITAHSSFRSCGSLIRLLIQTVAFMGVAVPTAALARCGWETNNP
jgi:hypothetical protein